MDLLIKNPGDQIRSEQDTEVRKIVHFNEFATVVTITNQTVIFTVVWTTASPQPPSPFGSSLYRHHRRTTTERREDQSRTARQQECTTPIAPSRREHDPWKNPSLLSQKIVPSRAPCRYLIARHRKLHRNQIGPTPAEPLPSTATFVGVVVSFVRQILGEVSVIIRNLLGGMLFFYCSGGDQCNLH